MYRLDGVTPAPVLLTRTPYDKNHPEVGSSFDILRAPNAHVLSGYVEGVTRQAASKLEEWLWERLG